MKLVIIGGGIIGLCSAYYALKRGLEVTVLERSAPDHDGCSLGNAGMIVPSHFVPLAAPGMVGFGLRMLLNPAAPFSLRPRAEAAFFEWLLRFWRAANPEHVKASAPVLRDLNLRSRALYQELSAELGDTFGLTQRGLVMLCRTEHTLHEEAAVAKMAHGMGMPAEVVTGPGLAALDPGVEMRAAGGVYFPQDCHLDPNRLMAALKTEVERLGGQIRWDTAVSAFRTSGGTVEAVETSSGDVTGTHYAVAGGAWSGALLRPLGIRLPLQAGKGYSLTLSHPRRLPELCSILVEARIAVTPMSGRLRFAGTMELAGLDLSVNPRRVEGMIHSIPAYLPDFQPEDFEEVPVWSGLRPCSPDGLPYIGPAPGCRNLLVAAGHAMMGLSLGPVTGELVAQLAAGETPTLDLNPVRIQRF